MVYLSYTSSLSHIKHHLMKPMTPKHLEIIAARMLEHKLLSTRTRNVPDLVEFEISKGGISLDYELNGYTFVTQTPLYFYAASLTQTRRIKQAPLEKVLESWKIRTWL